MPGFLLGKKGIGFHQVDFDIKLNNRSDTKFDRIVSFWFMYVSWDFSVFRTNVPQISQIDADLACESPTSASVLFIK
jgi:hypothetical protein